MTPDELEEIKRRERATLAERIHDGHRAESEAEDLLDDLWPELVHHIATDAYDNSLEVYFELATPGDLQATEKEAQAIFAMGFSRFWLNFADGTEQQVSNVWVDKGLHICQRRRVRYPKWTEEKARRFDSVGL